MNRWTEAEVHFAVQNYGRMTARQIASALGRSYSSVRGKLLNIGARLSEEDFAKAIKSPRLSSQHGENNPNWKGGVRRSAFENKKLDRQRHYKHHRAREKVYAAIRSGRLERRPCEVCGDIKSESHHEDYDKPLEVNWLCRKHHIELHKRKKIATAAN